MNMAELTSQEIVEVRNPNLEVGIGTMAASNDTYTCKKLKRVVGCVVTRLGTPVDADALGCTVSTNVITFKAANTTNPIVSFIAYGY